MNIFIKRTAEFTTAMLIAVSTVVATISCLAMFATQGSLANKTEILYFLLAAVAILLVGFKMKVRLEKNIPDNELVAKNKISENNDSCLKISMHPIAKRHIEKKIRDNELATKKKIIISSMAKPVAACLFVIAVLLFYRYWVEQNKGQFTYLLYGIGVAAMSLIILCLGLESKCPECKKWFVGSTIKSVRTGRVPSTRTVTRSDVIRDAKGERMGTIERKEQEACIHKYYEDHKECSCCDAKWVKKRHVVCSA